MTDWLDGPGFVAWLEDHKYQELSSNTIPTFIRAIQHWRAGRSLVSVYTADRLLVELGLHLSDVPDELYVEHPSPLATP